MNRHPNEEAKMTAVQIRAGLLAALEAAIVNDWDGVVEHSRNTAFLVHHVRQIESTYSDEEEG